MTSPFSPMLIWPAGNKVFLLSVIITITSFSLLAQDFSNKGRDFWIGYGNHVRMFNTGQAEQMQLYITSDAGTNGKVEIPGIGFSQAFTVTANQITTINIPRTAGLFDEGQYNLGIHVSAEKPVVVYSFIYVNAISGATVCLPTATLGKEYYVLNYKQVSNEANSYSYFFVVAADTGITNVEITPSQNSKNGLQANTAHTFTLTQGQVYQVLSQTDLSGSRIRSVSSATGGCKKIAVFCGSGKISIGCSGAGTSDNLYQQMYPVSTWGKRYITTSSINSINTGGQVNYYRVFKSDPTATVSLNGSVIPPASFISKQYYEFSSNQTNYIESDKPVLVAQYFTTQGCSGNGGEGDPEMIYLNPLEQTIDRVTLNSMQPVSGTNINQHYINAVLPNAPGAVNSFKIDGLTPSASFTSVPQNPGYAYIRVNLSQGTHNITCDSGFNAIAYGFGNAESYGYSAGTNLKDLYQFVSIRNEFATVNFPAGCKNSPFRFFMTFPYQPLSVKWQFNGLFPDTTVDNPVPDSVWVVNGRTLYRYPLGKFYRINKVGTYPITVIADNPGIDGCGGQQEVDYDLQIFDPPKAAFNWTNNGCITDPVLFRDSTNGNGRPVIKWYWNFGEGNTAVSKNPSYSYASGGIFQVMLATITDVGCLSDAAAQMLKIADPPNVNFLLRGFSCEKNIVSFADQSMATTGTSMVKWHWGFGDGDSLVNPANSTVQHVYALAGNYNVTLQVETSTGCSSAVKTIPVTIHNLPVAGFLMPDVCLNDPIAQFYDNSSIADHSETGFTHLWHFVDGAASTQKDGQHRYAAVGVYTVKLAVTSKDGCSRDTSKSFTVNGSVPLANFTVTDPTALCSNKTVSITDASTVDFGKIIRVEIYWDYRNDPTVKTVDSTPLAGKSYTHRYPEFGNPASKLFEVRYVVYSGITCLNQFSRVIVVNGSPAITFSSLPAVCEEITPFTFTAAGEIYGYTGAGVYSGDGIISLQGLFNPKLAKPGLHTILYRFDAANGCSAQQSQTILVKPSPLVDAGADRYLLEGGYIQLQPTYSGRGLSYLWSPAAYLDDSRSPAPKVTAPDDITYTITVTSADGCRASNDVLVKVLKKPKVPNAFSPNGDGINDTWVIEYLNSYPGCTVNVYNRYGQLVYHSTGYARPWDGSINGRPLPVGVYYWIINPKNGRSQMNGSVTIVR
jgi:gliding motility-associated-like protein